MMAKTIGTFCLTLALGLAGVVGGSAAAGNDITGLGIGRCFFSGCYCRSFVGYGFTCQNCGHNANWH